MDECEALSGRQTVINPYQGALDVSVWLMGLFLAVTLVAVALMGRDDGGFFAALAGVSGGLFFLFGLIGLVVWVLGWRTRRQASAFLSSARPLVCWVYTAQEWAQVKSPAWQEAQEDWRPQWGCLTFLFALVGLLTGGLVGAEEGLAEALRWGLVGALGGAAAGGVMGAVVAGSNYVTARRAYRRSEPDPVALAPHELYANGEYFRGDGVTRYIRHAELEPGDPLILRIEARRPALPRVPPELEWRIVVPARMVKAVTGALPLLARPEKSRDADDDFPS